MDAYKEVARALAEGMVMIAAVDGQVHEQEQKILLHSLKTLWNPGYGSLRSAVVGAFHEARLVRDFGIDLDKKMEKHALLLSRVMTAKEKKAYLEGIERIIRADGVPDSAEIRLYTGFKKTLEAEAGILGALKSAFGGIFG